MKNFYNFLLKKTSILILVLTVLGVSGNAQTRKDTLLIHWNELYNGSTGDNSDFQYFELTSDCGAVSNFKAEVIYDNYSFDTYILDIRDPDKNVYSVDDVVFTLDTVINYYDPVIKWVMWQYESESGGTGDSATVRITYDFDSIYTPQAVCKDTFVVLDATGNATLNAEDVDGGSDGCLSVSPSSFDCADIGTNTVTLTATATDGTTSTCEALVEVTNVSCKDSVLYLEANGMATLEAIDLLVDSTHSCGVIDSLWLSQDTFYAADAGENLITLYARTKTETTTDTAVCRSLVTVMDTFMTTANCKDTTLYLDVSGITSIKATDIYNGDGVDVDTMWLSQYDFGCADMPSTSVTLSVESTLGDITRCQSIIFVEDTISPQVTCVDTTVYLDVNGSFDLTVDHVYGGSSDNCDTPTLSIDQSAFNCLSSGENSVQLTATDNSGNTGSCIAQVTVEDTLFPTAVCQDITIQLDENDSYVLDASEIDGGSADNCEIALMATDMKEFDCSNIGDNTVTLTVTDNAGNQSTCTAIVTVEDIMAPVLQCQETTIYLRDNGVYVLSREEIRRIALGNNFDSPCASSDFLDVSISQRLFECEHAGASVPVTITATDNQGLVSTCDTHINVRDTVTPVVSCVDKEFELYLDETGTAELSADSVLADATDACEPLTMELSQSVFTCDDTGEHTVTLTASDPSNNSNSCSVSVMVYDTIAPTVDTIENIEIQLEAGVCESTIDYPEPQVHDNCNVEYELLEGLGEEGVFPAGTTTEEWRVTDPGGNSTTFSFTVTLIPVNDTPTINEVDDVVVFEGNSPVTVDLTEISSGDEDCNPQDVTITVDYSNTDLITNVTVDYTQGSSTGSLGLELAPEMTGESEITVTVEDTEGAQISETFILTVNPELNEPPVVVNPIPDQVVNASYVLKIPISTETGEYFDDPNDDELTFEVMLENGDPLPEWAVFENDTLTAEPMIEDTGCVMIVVEATDVEGETAADTFQVCVEGYPVNAGELANQLDVQIYPNPTRGLVNIELNSSAIVHDVDFSVHDITGRQILRKQYSASERISFNLNENVSGMYFIKLNVDGNQILKKVVLDRQ